jgi:hypothetical protein
MGPGLWGVIRAGARRLTPLAVVLLFASAAPAQDYEVGRGGWQLERLGEDFVLLRAEILKVEAPEKRRRQGLVILACEGGSRRIRFQLSENPRAPSTQASAEGRALLRAWRNEAVSGALHAKARFFEDGSFELQESAPFGDAVVRGFVDLLARLPGELEVVLFQGPETGRFVRGQGLRFRLEEVDPSLAQIYGFEGLCTRAPP